MARSRFRARDDGSWGGGNSRRRQGQNQRNRGFASRIQGQMVSFFFYNFPDNWDAKALWNRFQECGRVGDVFVPARRDRWGKRFGFVRMLGVKDVQQLEGSLNQIWIGSYKLRVKVAIDRGQKGADNQRNARLKGRITEQSYVKPGWSYVQAVKGQSLRSAGVQVWRKSAGTQERADPADKVSITHGRAEPTDRVSITQGNPLELEVVKACENGSLVGEYSEGVIDFSPSKEEIKWLDGSFVMVVRSMSLISTIQERVDVDGGLITLSPLGGRSLLLSERVDGYLIEYIQHNKDLFDLWCEEIYPWHLAPLNRGRMVWLRISGVPLQAWCDRCFERIAETMGEVVMLHTDTKSKAILCDGRVLILSDDKHKVSKTLKLKVEEKLFEILVTEEEWRADPDWWLAEEDRQGGSTSGSEYSSSENGGEDPELMMAEICGEEEVETDAELVQEKDILNLNEEAITGGAQLVSAEEFGPGMNLGSLLDSNSGVRVGCGPDPGEAKLQEPGGLGLIADSGKTGEQQDKSDGQINNILHLGIRDSRGRKTKDLKDCYPQAQTTKGVAVSQGISGRTMLRSSRVHNEQQVEATQAQRVGGLSLSDGCIANRNQVLQREMTLQEVRRIFSVGKRLGIQLQDIEDEVQSRLLELEVRDAGQGKA
ncbi:hypothetical protein SLE2022_118570 [Rubroshorea leprosula]